jgi:serine phosphatase RsbU (regulator of sigma subunit)
MDHVKNTEHLQRLVDAVKALSLARDLDTVMSIVRRTARELTGADGATFVLRDRIGDAEACFYADEDAISPLWKGSRFPIETCISGWAMLNSRPAVIEDIYKDPRIPHEAYKPTFVKSLAMVPIRTSDPIGAIGNYWADQHMPSEEEVSLLQSLADITAVTMENINVYNELEHRVKDRTAQLHEKNQEITDSIAYARRIQNAVLPPFSLVQEHFKDSFILYKPRDIVSGDFYWFEKKGEVMLIAAADCTGHGVPGAMLSVVCSNALYRSVNEFGLTVPGNILDKTRELVLENLAKSGEGINDGMDISLCAVDSKTGKVTWSGANNNLWYLSNNALCEVKAHKQPIGRTNTPTPFPTHEIPIRTGDIFYLVTDGFADQFGGDKGKKFKRRQLEALLHATGSMPLATQKRTLEHVFTNWKGELEQVDDVTIVGVRI